MDKYSQRARYPTIVVQVSDQRKNRTVLMRRVARALGNHGVNQAEIELFVDQAVPAEDLVDLIQKWVKTS